MQTARVILNLSAPNLSGLELSDLGSAPFTFLLAKQKYPESFHHLQRVLRVKKEWEVELLDEETSLVLYGKISEISSESIEIAINTSRKKERKTRLTVILGLPDFGVLENTVEKLTEIQTSALKIFIPKNTQHKNAEERLYAKLERLGKIKNSARIQSGASPLSIGLFRCLESALNDLPQKIDPPDSLRFIASLEDHSSNLQEYLHKNCALEPISQPTDIYLIVGPEGDLGFEEYQLANKFGFKPVSLGDSVLRVETATITAAFCLLNYFN